MGGSRVCLARIWLCCKPPPPGKMRPHCRWSRVLGRGRDAAPGLGGTMYSLRRMLVSPSSALERTATALRSEAN